MGCTACGAGPHQPCRYNERLAGYAREHRGEKLLDPDCVVRNSKVYAWMEKRFWVSRSGLMIFVLLGFALGLSTCGMLT